MAERCRCVAVVLIKWRDAILQAIEHHGMAVRGEAVAVDERKVGRKVKDAGLCVAGLDGGDMLQSVSRVSLACTGLREPQTGVLECRAYLRLGRDAPDLDPAESEVEQSCGELELCAE